MHHTIKVLIKENCNDTYVPCCGGMLEMLSNGTGRAILSATSRASGARYIRNGGFVYGPAAYEGYGLVRLPISLSAKRHLVQQGFFRTTTCTSHHSE